MSQDTTRHGGPPGRGDSGPQNLAGRSFGPYQVIREIARGGQGVVLEARHLQLGTKVALKVLLEREPAASPDAAREPQARSPRCRRRRR